jgi:topoisomerase-4 subunit B
MSYSEKDIQSLDWRTHLRERPGMYIGKLGDGSAPDDGIYVLLKEVLDNSIDEFIMGYGNRIEITLKDRTLTVRDYGRGIPLGKLVDCAGKINTGAKYGSEAFKKSVGLNGVGIKATNALSEVFVIKSVREGKEKQAAFVRGNLEKEGAVRSSTQKPGTFVQFTPDPQIFGDYQFREEFIESMLWNYAYLNTGLTLEFNGKQFFSETGLHHLLTNALSSEACYPIVHIRHGDIELAFTHTNQYGEEYYSFVNGQHTTQGGTHLAAFKEAFTKVVRDTLKKEYDGSDIRTGLVAAISVKIHEPIFESQTKTKLGSQTINPKDPSAPTIRAFVSGAMKEVENYFFKNPTVVAALQARVLQAEADRKEIQSIQKVAKEQAKIAKVNNKKLRDCSIHFNTRNKRKLESSIFITEGDSASGSITKVRDVETQAVFSLKGKPLNTFGLKKSIVYENEEFNLLQHALNIEQGLDELRYNQVIIATDADVDGMHIRLLLITFFLQFFPELIKRGHLYILQTPLFKVSTEKTTIYCFTEKEKDAAAAKLGARAEINRFKGLGEIDPDEFATFIGPKMRLEQVRIDHTVHIQEMLSFYMGKNTPERQEFIIKNLKLNENL